MAQLRRDYIEFVSRGAEVIAIGPDRAADFVSFWQEHDMPFIGLADPRHTVSRIYRQQVNLLKLGRMPAQMIVDRHGAMRYLHYGQSMSDIPENAELIAVLDQLNAETQPEGAS